jgi:hypothetical protein
METEKTDKKKKKLTKEQIKKLRELKQRQIDDHEMIKK